MKYVNIARAMYSSPWAIRGEKLAVIMDFVRAKCAGEELPPIKTEKHEMLTYFLDCEGLHCFTEELMADSVACAKAVAGSGGAKSNGVAVIPVFGTLVPRANILSRTSGTTSVEQLTKQFKAAVQDPSVGSIVFDADTPGGNVQGIAEFADEIFNARGQKRIIGVANAEAASAGYWLLSQTDELIVTPSGEVGSIGVIAMHDDMSKALEMTGIKTTMITAGKYKGEGWPEFPLSAEARDYMQSQVDAYYSMFTKAVARGRGVAQKTVRDGFGQGRMMMAVPAVREGMADGIGTLDEVVSRLLSGKSAVAAELRTDEPTAIGFSVEDERRRFELATR